MLSEHPQTEPHVLSAFIEKASSSMPGFLSLLILGHAYATKPSISFIFVNMETTTNMYEGAVGDACVV
jgi:hypothetical protein